MWDGWRILNWTQAASLRQRGEKALSKLGIDLKIDIRETTKDELKEIKKRIKDKKH